jgi:hypothetical protein
MTANDSGDAVTAGRGSNDVHGVRALTTAERPVSRRQRTRWLVHVGLILSVTVSLFFEPVLLMVHIVVGLVFVAFVMVHLTQRRRTTGQLARQLARVRSWKSPRGRLAFSDLVLALLTLNVLVSGIVDWTGRHGTGFPLQALTGLPIPAFPWHVDSSVALLGYLLVHTLRRKTHLRRSQIR